MPGERAHWATRLLDRAAWVALIPAVAVFLYFGDKTSKASWITLGGVRRRFPIVDLELAGSEERAADVFTRFLDQFPSVSDPAVALQSIVDGITSSLAWDMGFIAGYALLLFALARLLRTQFQMQRVRTLGMVLSWAALAAGLLDVVENVALWRLVARRTAGAVGFPKGDWWAELAAGAAWPKWVLIVLVGAYVAVGLYLWMVRGLAWVGRQIGELGLIQNVVRAWRRIRGTGADPTRLTPDEPRGQAVGIFPQKLTPPDPAFRPEAVLRRLLRDDSQPKGLSPAQRAEARQGALLHLERGTPEVWVLEQLELRGSAENLASDWEVPRQWIDDVAAVGRTMRSWQPPDDDVKRIGICSSGGGLRSASYNLGALQALTDCGIYSEAEYHAAVSGGAYIAGAYTMLAAHSQPPPTAQLPAFSPGSPEAEHLRRNSKYLLPDFIEAAGALSRGALGIGFNLLIIGLLLFVLARPWGWVMSADFMYPTLRDHELGALIGAADTLAARARDAAGGPEGISESIVGLREAGVALDEAIVAFDCSIDDAALGCREPPDTTSRAVQEALRTLDGAALGITDDVLGGGPIEERTGELLRIAEGATLVADAARRHAKPPIPFNGGWWGIAGAAVLMGLFGLASVGFYHSELRRQWLGKAAALFAVVTILLLLTIVVMPFVVSRGVSWIVSQSGELFASVQVAGGATLAAGALRTLTTSAPSLLGRFAGGLVAPALAALAVLNFTSGGAAQSPADGSVWVIAALVAFIFVTSASDLNAWSLHPLYRRRLSSVFAVKRAGGPGVEPIAGDELLLTNSAVAAGPELVVCAIANVTTVGAVPPGLSSRSLTFTPREINASGLGRITAADMEHALGKRRAARDIGMPSAVAMSGAAAAPGMGKQTKRSLQALLALANVRLGIWLPNPTWVQQLRADNALDRETWSRRSMKGTEWHDKRWVDRVRATYLFKEIFGIYREDDKYLYITDGGHWENLGLVELLRRGCTEIWCIDSAGNPPDQFPTLGEAIALARMELGVEVTGVPEDMRPPVILDKDKPIEAASYIRSPRCFVALDFTYPSGTTGTIYYCKAAVTDDAPVDVRMYQEANPIFPAHSTADQLFDHEQFEAYRRLGYHTASLAVAKAYPGNPCPPSGRSAVPPNPPPGSTRSRTGRPRDGDDAGADRLVQEEAAHEEAAPEGEIPTREETPKPVWLRAIERVFGEPPG